VAKKVRRRPDEEAEEKAFDFPVFDEASFAAKEFALTNGVLLASGIAIALGAFSWVCTSLGAPWYLPFPVAFLLAVLSPAFLGRLLPGSSAYTRGDWAGMVALEFFGFLGVWFVLVKSI
jgi:hypothetical protein